MVAVGGGRPIPWGIQISPTAVSSQRRANQPHGGTLHPEEQHTIVEAHQPPVLDVGPAAAGLVQGQVPNGQPRRQAFQRAGAWPACSCQTPQPQVSRVGPWGRASRRSPRLITVGRPALHFRAGGPASAAGIGPRFPSRLIGDLRAAASGVKEGLLEGQPGRRSGSEGRGNRGCCRRSGCCSAPSGWHRPGRGAGGAGPGAGGRFPRGWPGCHRRSAGFSGEGGWFRR